MQTTRATHAHLPYFKLLYTWADPEGGKGVWTPLKNHKNIGFLCNTGPDPLKNHKTTKTAVNVWPLSVQQRIAVSMAFC